MAIKTYLTAIDPKNAGSLKTDDKEFLTTLGKEEDNVAIQINELLESLTEKVTESITLPSQLTIEISGAISLKAEAGIKYLFFNVGGSAESSNSMKVTLNTTINPKS